MTTVVALGALALAIGWAMAQAEPASGSKYGYSLVLYALFAAAGIVGALLGFLFGLPRARFTDPVLGGTPASLSTPETSLPGTSQGSKHYLANSNLIKVSDWLTTIVVGLTLVNLGKLFPAIQDLAGILREPLGDTPAAGVIGVSVVVLGALTGFILMYLYVSIRIRELLEESEALGNITLSFNGLTLQQATAVASQLGVEIELASQADPDDIVKDQEWKPGIPRKVKLTTKAP